MEKETGDKKCKLDICVFNFTMGFYRFWVLGWALNSN